LVRDDLVEALDGCEIVVHLAGRTRAATLDQYLQANAESAMQVAQAARDTRTRLIHISSQAAAGTGTIEDPRSEDDPPRPISDYGRSKLAGEKVVEQVEGLEYSILRPCAVYGPEDKNFVPLFKWGQRGVYPIVGQADAAFSFIYVGDLVRVIEIVMRQPETNSKVFFVSEKEPHSTESFLQLLAEACDKRFRPVRIPSPFLWLIMALGIPASYLGLSPLLTPSRYRELMSEGFVCNPERLTRTTGFEARVGLAEGLRKTIAWYTEAHVDGSAG
jgi:nucleoside-diphosphate-sugar epimerase